LVFTQKNTAIYVILFPGLHQLIWTAVKNCTTGVQSLAGTVETFSLSQVENGYDVHTASFSSCSSKGLLRLSSLLT
jgi:hypothetical protein